MKTVKFLGFFSLLLTALPHNTAHALDLPSPKAIFDKLKPGLDTTRSLENAVGLLRTVAEKLPGDSFKKNQEYYQIPTYIPDRLKAKMQALSNTDTLTVAGNADSIKIPAHQTTDLSEKEHDFINARLEHIANHFQFIAATTPASKKNGGSNPAIAFQKIDPSDPDSIPRIAVCASGGGFRAMIATMGFWDGMQRTNLDKLMLMTSCLSGSTWFTMPWAIGKEISQLKATYEKYALIPLGKTLPQTLFNPLALPQSKTTTDCLFPELNIISNKFAQAFYWSHPYNLVQPYGNLIGHMTLGSFDDPEIIKIQEHGYTNDLTNYLQNPSQAPYTGPNAIQSRQTVYLSQAADFLMENPDKRPLPLATSITQYEGTWWSTAKTISKTQKSFDGYGWITYTPFDVEMNFYDGSGMRHGSRIETPYLGRQFGAIKKAPSRWHRIFINPTTVGYGAINNAPEYTLNYLMGIWGSAFNISIDYILHGNGLENAIDPDAVDTTAKDNKSQSSIMTHVKQALGGSLSYVAKKGISTFSSFGNFRLLPAVINNFVVFPDSPFSDHTTLITMDAGIAFNLPFPPLLKPERKIDMIIALDASADVADGQLGALVGAERWAAEHGIPFPSITKSKQYNGASKRAFTVFDEFDESVPVDQRKPIVFYIPLVDTCFDCSCQRVETTVKSCSDNQQVKDFTIKKCLNAACSTFNFNYQPTPTEPEPVNSLAWHASCAVLNMRQSILTNIEQIIRKKNNMPLLAPEKLQTSTPYPPSCPAKESVATAA